MSKKKQQKKQEPVVTVPQSKPVEQAPCWKIFFRDQRSPFLRSQLITALMTGHPFEVERLPASSLLDVVLLSMTARNYHEAEIIDDYNALLRRADELWKDPMWTRKVFDQTHMGAADFIIRGMTEFLCYEDQYVPDLVGWFLEHEPPVYFSEELAA
jgi:hypothetical protein